MERNQVHNEIKAIIAQNGLTLTEVVTRMNQHRTPDERTTVQNISNKLARGTIKYSEALEMAAVIGLRITWDKTKALLDARHPETELVFTGRGAPQELIDEADLVTEMQEVKHYYTQGVLSRDGIDR